MSDAFPPQGSEDDACLCELAPRAVCPRHLVSVEKDDVIGYAIARLCRSCEQSESGEFHYAFGEGASSVVGLELIRGE